MTLGPDYVPARGGQLEHVKSVPVVVYPAERDHCVRIVRLSGVTVSIAISSYASPVVPQNACLVADAAVDLVISLKGTDLGTRPIASATIATIDLCHTLSRDAAAKLLGAHDVVLGTAQFGALCVWRTSSRELAARTSFTDSYGKILGDTITAGGHRLIHQDHYQDPSGCRYSSAQGKIKKTRSQEFLDIDVYPLHGTELTSRLCTLARQGAEMILNGAGLH